MLSPRWYLIYSFMTPVVLCFSFPFSCCILSVIMFVFSVEISGHFPRRYPAVTVMWLISNLENVCVCVCVCNDHSDCGSFVGSVLMLVTYKVTHPLATAGSGWWSVFGTQPAASQARPCHGTHDHIQQLNGIRWLPGDPHDHVTCLHASPLPWCHVKMLTNHVLSFVGGLSVYFSFVFVHCVFAPCPWVVLGLVCVFFRLQYLLYGILCFCMESIALFGRWKASWTRSVGNFWIDVSSNLKCAKLVKFEF